MAVTLPLSEMSLPEKLQLMESLWEDLSRNVNVLDSPEWHGTILQEREKNIEAGTAQFIDWEKVKTEIRQHVT